MRWRRFRRKWLETRIEWRSAIIFAGARYDFLYCTSVSRGSGIRERDQLIAQFGLGNWLKKKGISQKKLPDGNIVMAEIHWYEAIGIGKVKIKVMERR